MWPLRIPNRIRFLARRLTPLVVGAVFGLPAAADDAQATKAQGMHVAVGKKVSASWCYGYLTV
jgi:hypothetical protein